MPVYLYMCGNDYANHFLTVCNLSAAVRPNVDGIDWMQNHRIACLPKKKQGKGHIEKKRQARFKDTGFCSSINQSQDSNNNGIAEPRLKPELTYDSEVLNGYVVLSKFIATAVTEWTKYRKRIFNDHN
jgi:hypothetical protein